VAALWQARTPAGRSFVERSDPEDFCLLGPNAPIYVGGTFIDPACWAGAEAVVPGNDFGDSEAGAGLCGSLEETLE
jgi:hypothetical protein